MKKNNLTGFFAHLGLFFLIEIIFVLLVFRELPETNLLTLVGLLHSSYRWIVMLAWWIREQYAHLVWQRFFCTYIPVIYHVIIHIVAWIVTIEQLDAERHHEQGFLWIVTGTLAAGILIALGEYWLHRTRHCDTHHVSVHMHCHDEECEEGH